MHIRLDIIESVAPCSTAVLIGSPIMSPDIVAGSFMVSTIANSQRYKYQFHSPFTALALIYDVYHFILVNCCFFADCSGGYMQRWVSQRFRRPNGAQIPSLLIISLFFSGISTCRQRKLIIASEIIVIIMMG